MDPERGGARAPKIGSGLLDSRWQLERVEAAHSLGISLAEFLGEVPSETHEHFDADGNPSGTTVVTRGSLWDDEQRQIMLDLAQHRRLTSRCGHHPATGMDKSVGRKVEHDRCECLDCTAIRVAREAWHKSHAKGDDKGPCDICADEVFWVDEYVPVG